MKNFKILVSIFSFSIFLLSGCKKEEEPVQYDGNASMMINTKSWSPLVQALSLDKKWPDTIYSIKFWNRYNAYMFMTVGLVCVPKKTGNYQIYKEHYLSDSDTVLHLNSFLYTEESGSGYWQWWDLYEPDSLTNKLIITSFDKTTNYFSGSFQCTYLAQHPDKVYDPPETIRIKNAVFTGRILR